MIAAVAIIVLALDIVFLMAYIVNMRGWYDYYRIARSRRPWWAK